MTIADELERLQTLRERGALTESEHAQAKAQVLGTASSAPAPSATGAAPPHNTFLRRLSLSTTDRVIGGVCGGLGAHTGLPSWAWRVIFCLSLLYFGIGLVFYLLLWIFIPVEPTAPPPHT
jgi:phage shock protein PspC (stress-responsive transcriptional regulator)